MSKHIDALLKSKSFIATRAYRVFLLSFQTGSLRKIFNVLKLISMQVIGASIMGVPISGILEKPKHFQTWLKHQVCNHQIDALVCFGDCRYYHVQAKQLAQRLGIPFLYLKRVMFDQITLLLKPMVLIIFQIFSISFISNLTV